MSTLRVALRSLAVLGALAACGGGDVAPPSKYPPRPEGCEVTLFKEAPTMPTDNIGTVSATCPVDAPQDDCLRRLKDETCKLGGDVVWGVPSEPTKTNTEKNRWSGRAAHTK